MVMFGYDFLMSLGIYGWEVWLLWEVFVWVNCGLSYVYVGLLYVLDVEMVICNVCDFYIWCGEGVLIWVVFVEVIIMSDFDVKGVYFESFVGKNYWYVVYYIVFEGVLYL